MTDSILFGIWTLCIWVLSAVVFEHYHDHSHVVVSEGIPLPCYEKVLVAEPEHKPIVARVIPSGELVAYWEIWEECNGPQCID